MVGMMTSTAAVSPPRAGRVQDGDIVVTRVAGSPARYAILCVPGAAQVCWASKQDAVALARGFAAASGVDLWLDDGFAWTHLDQRRARSR